MLISTVCPHCQTRYQVAASLKGVTIRCPNATCGKAFVVAELGSSGNGPGSVSGGVGDMVPLVDGESLAPPNPSRKTKSGTTHVEEILPVIDTEMADAPSSEGRSCANRLLSAGGGA